MPHVACVYRSKDEVQPETASQPGPRGPVVEWIRPRGETDLTRGVMIGSLNEV